MTAASISRLRDQATEHGRAFLRWWLSELWGMMPAALRRRLPKGRRPAVCDLSGEAPRIRHQGEGWRPLTESKDKTNGRTAPVNAEVIVDPNLVFRKEITLPKMPTAQARAALRLQLNRHIPFPAADVVFDCRLTGEDSETGTVTAELAVMRRADRAALYERLSVHGVTPTRIGLADGAEAGVVFDFRERVAASAFNRRHGLLALLAAVLALAALFAVEDRRAAELDAWRAVAAEQAKAAAEAKALRSELTALEERTAFLQGQWQAVPRVALLETLSKALPDGTWLESVEITGSRIKLTGYSDQASSVPERLQKTGRIRNLQFVSAVSSTAKPGIDRFDVEGVIR